MPVMHVSQLVPHPPLSAQKVGDTGVLSSNSGPEHVQPVKRKVSFATASAPVWKSTTEAGIHEVFSNGSISAASPPIWLLLGRGEFSCPLLDARRGNVVERAAPRLEMDLPRSFDFRTGPTSPRPTCGRSFPTTTARAPSTLRSRTRAASRATPRADIDPSSLSRRRGVAPQK